MSGKNYLRILPYVILLLICVPVVIPFFHTGYFPTHDGEWAVVRLGDMFRQLRDLQFPPRYSGALNFGYGYPLFNFAYPFPYYLGILLYVPIHNFVNSIKIIFAGSVFLSAFFMYRASYQLWKSRGAGIVSAIIYTYLPYRMVDLYVRGSIGESLSLALFPLIFLLSLKLFDAPFKRSTVVFLAISISTLVLTHNIMTILFMPILLFIILMKIFLEKRFDVLQSFLLVIFLGAGLSSFFWIPALLEKNNILLSKIPIADRSLYFVKLEQLLIPRWGFAPPTEAGGFSYQIGLAQLLSIFVSLVLFVKAVVKTGFNFTPVKKDVLLLFIALISCIFMLFPVSGFLWQLPLLKEINYPWTFLSQIGFISALVSGFLMTQGKIIKILSFSICIVSIIATLPYARPQSYIDKGDQYYLTNEGTTTSSSELMPLWVKSIPKEHFKDKVEVVKGSAQISNLLIKSNRIHFNFKTANDVVFRINTIYYPGWKAYVNNELADITYNNQKGVMEIPANQYRDSVTLIFQETLIRILSDGLSILSLLVIGFILLRPVLLFKS